MNGKKIWMAVVLAIIIMMGFVTYQKKHSQREFLSEEWKQNQSSRQYMLNDLLERYDLTGMEKKQVHELLGEYGLRQEAYLSDDHKVDYYWGYYLRDDWFDGQEFLLIAFKDGRVKRIETAYLWEL